MFHHSSAKKYWAQCDGTVDTIAVYLNVGVFVKTGVLKCDDGVGGAGNS